MGLVFLAGDDAGEVATAGDGAADGRAALQKQLEQEETFLPPGIVRPLVLAVLGVVPRV